MRYKAYYNNSKCRVSNNGYFYYIGPSKTPKPSKHREEIEEYLSNMAEPRLTDNGDQTVTLSFTPMSEEMATWMSDSKTVFFYIVRQKIGNGATRYSRDNHKKTKGTASDYFPYDWDYTVINDITIPNTEADMINRNISKQEFINGEINRDISHIYDFTYSNSWSKARACAFDNFYLEFYMGIVYFDDRNIPTLYKMGKFDVLAGDFNN